MVGPMFLRVMEVKETTGYTGTPRKRTQWVTNSPMLAKTLDVRCSDELDTEPFHDQAHLINVFAKQAAKYHLTLVRAVEKALKAQMAQVGKINQIIMKFGVPDPTQELFDGNHEEGRIDEIFGGDNDDDNTNDDERYHDDTSGVERPETLNASRASKGT